MKTELNDDMSKEKKTEDLTRRDAIKKLAKAAVILPAITTIIDVKKNVVYASS